MSYSGSATTESVQSITVPGWTKVTQPSPHTVFSLAVSLPTRSYSIQQRYSAFTSLEHALTAACGAAPPATLPPKHPGASWLNPFKAAAGGTALSDEQLESRRDGLERWLRAILADRDPRWRSSRAFKEFLAAPPGPGSMVVGSSSKEATMKGEAFDREWTTTGWTREYESLEAAARSLRAVVDRRDAQLLENSSAAHGSAKEAKTALVELVQRLGALARGLEDLANKGMTDGEVQRRSDLIQRMQGEVEDLGRKAGSAPRVGAGRRTRDGDVEDETPSVARQALLGGGGSSSKKATTRVLGAGAPAPETAETRPLDNQGIMQLQQNYMDDQDQKLESLTAALRRQRHLGEMINQELALQEDVIDQLERGTDRVSGKIKSASKQMKRL
ncbi:hypothetical protein JCM10212_004720 [Sporobolomyces blumeae]